MSYPLNIWDEHEQTVRQDMVDRTVAHHTEGVEPCDEHPGECTTHEVFAPLPAPAYRQLIEVPEHYHLWRDDAHQAVYLTVELDATDDGTGTWLRKRAFGDLDWRYVSKHPEAWDAHRGFIQQRVNATVAAWRKDHGAP